MYCHSMSQSDELLQSWDSEPEPLQDEGDPRIVLDCNDSISSAYLWDVKNSSDGWLSFDGKLVDIKR